MSNISERINRLDIKQARLLTQSEIAGGESTSGNSLSKYSIIKPTRPIKKIQTIIRFPVCNVFIPFGSVDFSTSRLQFQWNVVIGQNWYVEPTYTTDFVKLKVGILVVKYRVGSTVTRYVIGGGGPPAVVYQLGNQFFPQIIPIYQNQELPSNVCFEWWNATNAGLAGFNSGLNFGYDLLTSIFVNPLTGDDLVNIIPAGTTYNIAALGNNLPETLPSNQPILAFNTN